jgi:methionyl-tRNA formyltransferase
MGSRRACKVVVLGEKRVAQQCLDFLHNRPDTEIVAVVTSEKDWQADLGSWARERNIPVFFGRAEDQLNAIAAARPELLFSIQYRYLVKPELLAVPSGGAYNLHFGMLPRYGGCYPVAWAIRNGEREAGVTLHQMTPRFDDGDIVAQRAVRIGRDCTARELFDELTTAGVALFAETYPSMLEGTQRRLAQDSSKRLYYSASSIDFQRDRFIDWRKPAEVVDRELRAFTFEPFQLPATRVRFSDGRISSMTVERDGSPEKAPGLSGLRPGSVAQSSDGASLLVVAGDGNLVALGRLDGLTVREYFKQNGLMPGGFQFIVPGE